MLHRHLGRTARSLFTLSTLGNGIRVASENSLGPFSAVGILVQSGARYEDQSFRGASYVIEKLALKSTKKRNTDQIAAAIEDLGGTFTITSSKDSIVYSVAINEKKLDEAMALLAEVLLLPNISKQDIQQVAGIAEYEIEEKSKKADELVPELAHVAGWKKETYGNGIMSIPEVIDTFKVETVEKYINWRYKPSNLIVSGAGLDHAKLKDATEKYFGQWKGSDVDFSVPKVEYCGGFLEVPDDSNELFHCGIAWKGVSLSQDEAFPLAVLQLLLGGGSAFSAGGPGKGMYSRLYTNILNRYHWVESAKVFNFPHKDDGIFGICGSSIPSQSSNLIKVLLNEMVNADKQIKPDEFQRAINQAKSTLLMGLESRIIQVEDMARQIQCLGKKMTLSEVIGRLDSVKPQDLTNVKKKIFSSNPTIVTYGNLSYKPAIDSMIRKLSK